MVRRCGCRRVRMRWRLERRQAGVRFVCWLSQLEAARRISPKSIGVLVPGVRAGVLRFSTGILSRISIDGAEEPGQFAGR